MRHVSEWRAYTHRTYTHTCLREYTNLVVGAFYSLWGSLGVLCGTWDTAMCCWLPPGRPSSLAGRARKGPGPHSIANLRAQVFADDLQLDVILLERFRWRRGSHDLPGAARRDDTRISGSDDDNWEGNPGNRHLVYEVGADKKPPVKFAPINWRITAFFACVDHPL